ncbi:hypothetical protein EVAR_24455_1 [Eumeta japonica]|uniref:Uncharacterized protein n=1 Tax=Eumeta variegata TaxID=151549 RepID=A0A4C1WYT4_EUMVA|nr:hypothetical protein EVAR_24455_1 [Eumeta japonica]
MKLCRSELPANDVMRRFNTPPTFLLLTLVPISHHCDPFVTNFAATEFRTLYYDSIVYVLVHVDRAGAVAGAGAERRGEFVFTLASLAARRLRE